MSMPLKNLADGQVPATEVKLLTADDGARWDEFVRHHESGTFYHLSGWRDVIGAYLHHPTFYLYVESEGVIQGVLPLARVKSRLFGDALVSMPFLVYGGPIANDDDAVRRLVGRATELANELGVDYLELRNRKPITDWPSKDTYVTFRKEISSDPEANLKAIPRKQRAVVRKAIKAGLETRMDSDAGPLHAVLSECKRNLGTPFFSRGYLQKVADTFGPDCEILTVVHDRFTVASVMSFRFRDEILPYYGGGGVQARALGGNDFMYWKVMERACTQGVRVFDYGRSQKDTGPYRFKKYWGFEPQPLSYEYYLVKAKKMPQLDPSNKRYQALIRAWTRLPLPIARLIGPHVARRLG